MDNTELRALLNGPDRFALVTKILTRNLEKNTMSEEDMHYIPQEATDVIEHILNTYEQNASDEGCFVKYMVMVDYHRERFSTGYNLRDVGSIEDICDDETMSADMKETCLESIFGYVESALTHMGFWADYFNEYIDDGDFGIGVKVGVCL